MKTIDGYPRYTIYEDGTIYDNESLRFLTISKSNVAGDKYYCLLNLRKDGKPKTFYLHTLLAKAFIPNPDNLTQVDHKDGNSLNNSLDNLRWATVQKNMQNRTTNKNSSSKYMGVAWDKSRNKWSAQIHIDNKKKFLGRFAIEEDAAKAYDIAAIKQGYEHYNFK